VSSASWAAGPPCGLRRRGQSPGQAATPGGGASNTRGAGRGRVGLAGGKGGREVAWGSTDSRHLLKEFSGWCRSRRYGVVYNGGQRNAAVLWQMEMPARPISPAACTPRLPLCNDHSGIH